MSGVRISEPRARGGRPILHRVKCVCLGMFSALTCAALATAQTLPAELPTKGALLERVYAGDMAGVEQALETAQRLYLDDAIAADEVRRLYEGFTTTNPRVIAFTGDWVRAMPDSPYANTARAWVLYHIARLIRGTRGDWDTYADALSQYEALNDSAMVHASSAFSLAPDLLPASDAILRLATSIGAASFGYEIMDKVMERRPNWGTLYRGLKLTVPELGGNAITGDAMCAYYGAVLDAPHEDMVRFCRIVGIFEFHLRGRRDLLEDLLDGFEAPELDYIRAKLAMLDWQNPDRMQKHQDVLQAYFDTHDVMDVKMAEEFDLFFNHLPGHRLVQGEVSKRAYDYAVDEIRDDPYDPWLLDVLSTGVVDVRRIEGGVRTTIVTRVTHAQRQEILRKRLAVSPFEPEHWSRLAGSMEAMARGDSPALDGLLTSDPYRINAIVYGNHRAEYLVEFILWKIVQLDVLARLTQVNTTPLAPRPAPSIDRDADIICPLLRAARVLGVVNAYADMPETNGLTAIQAGQIRTLSDQARDEGRCTEVRGLDPLELAFEPVAVSLVLSPLLDQL